MACGDASYNDAVTTFAHLLTRLLVYANLAALV